MNKKLLLCGSITFNAYNNVTFLDRITQMKGKSSQNILNEYLFFIKTDKNE